MFISVLGRYVPSSKLGITLCISTQTFWRVVTPSVDSCAEMKSALQWRNSSVGVTSSGRVWRKMPESDARSVIRTQIVRRALTASVDSCAEIKSAPAVA